ncbi:MAG: hypothetical protein HY318_17005, partial [Armatimonadetes bacterium]|nr:hypothetical protein [Armatimonadota bacterium]
MTGPALRANNQDAISAFSLRALIIGLIGVLIIGLGGPYATNVIQGAYVALDFTTPGAVFLFLVLVGLVNVLLGCLKPQWKLEPWELIIVYIMMIIASAIPDMGLAAQILPLLVAPFYYASEEDNWAELLHRHLNPDLVPHGKDVVRYFFEGLPHGHHIPWEAWIKPLACWAPFLLALYFVMIALMVIVRRQWSENERMIYPLTVLPLEMVRDDNHLVNPFFRNPIMWIGFAIPFFFGCLAALHNYNPAFPEIKMASQMPVFRNTMQLVVRLSFPMLGFFYLVNLETAFSLWFFNVLGQILRGMMNINALGFQGLLIKENLGIYGTPNSVFAHLGMGAMITLVVGGMWTGRSHLRNVCRKAFLNDPRVDDSSEVMSYRMAVIGSLVGLSFMAVWLCWAGLPVVPMLLFLFGTFVLFIGLTRVVSESGLSEAVASTIGSSFVISGLGTAALGPQGLAAMGLTYVWCSDIRTFVMASTATGLKLADITPSRRRALSWNMILAVVVALVASVLLTLALSYLHGGLKLNDWFYQGGPKACWEFVADKINNPHKAIWSGWWVTAIGAGAMWCLQVLRQRFLWWPFHPLGFCVGTVWIMDQLWLTCLIAWAIKAAIVRYGGPRTFLRLRPFFLGLVAGQFFVNGLWIIIDAFTGKRGNSIFWI